MKERILAIVGAVTLVVVAVVVRGQLAGDDDAAGGGGGGGGGGGRPVVACSAGLDEICDVLAAEGLIAVDPPSFDLGSTGATTGVVDERRVDAWITWNPAGAIANFDAKAETGDEVWDAPVAVGSSPIALAGKPSLRGVGCAEPTWTCLAAVVDADNAVAVGDPATVDGLLRVHPLVAALLGPDDLLEDLDDLLVEGVVESSTARPAPFPTQLVLFDTKPGTFHVIVGPETELRDRDRDVALPPTPAGGVVPTMALVVTPRMGASTGWVDRAFDRPAVEAAVRDAGVDPGSATLAGTPDAGQLHALRERLTG